MPTRTESAVVAVFSTISDAQAAAGELTANAFAGDHIHIASESTGANPDTEALQSRSAGHLREMWRVGANQLSGESGYRARAL